MRLCFGSFAETLIKYRKNSGVSREQVGRALLDFIDPGFVQGKENSYIYSFINRKRELPADLKRCEFTHDALARQFRAFAEKNLSPAHTELLDELAALIQEDEHISDETQEALLGHLGVLDLPVFLSELFAFIVSNTNNRAHTDDLHIRKRSLLAQADATDNNVRLAKVALKSMEAPDEPALRRCLERMTNAVYVTSTLVALSRHEVFPQLKTLFHEQLSGVENNKYRYQIFEECLREGYFSEHPGELLSSHFAEFTNNRYAYNLLVFLCENGLREEAGCHKDKLTNTTYSNRFEAYLTEN